MHLISGKKEVVYEIQYKIHFFPWGELSMSYKAKPSLEKGAEKI